MRSVGPRRTLRAGLARRALRSRVALRACGSLRPVGARRSGRSGRAGGVVGLREVRAVEPPEPETVLVEGAAVAVARRREEERAVLRRRQAAVATRERADDESVGAGRDLGGDVHGRVREDDRAGVTHPRRRVVVTPGGERDRERPGALGDGERGTLVEREPPSARREREPRRQGRRLAVVGHLDPESVADVREAQHAPKIADRLLRRLFQVVQMLRGDAQSIDEDCSLLVAHGLFLTRSCTAAPPR